jgi:hypothetical protein
MSDQAPKTFGEQLIRSQTFTPSAAERYRSEMEAFSERMVPPRYRWGGIALAVMYLALAAGPLLLRERWEGMPLLRGLVLPMSITCLVASAWCVGIALRGKYNRKSQSQLTALLAVIAGGFGGMAMLEHGWVSADPMVQRRLIVAGAMMLLCVGGAISAAYIEELHRRTEERLIRLEYRIAELSEKIDRPQKGSDN